MIKDRLSELNRPGQLEIVVDSNDDLTDGQGSLSPEFFEEVGQIRSLTSLIRRNVKSIEEAYNKQAWSSADKNSQKTQELEDLMESTNSAAIKVRTKLKTMKDANDALPSEDSQKKTRTHIHNVLTQKFISLITEYQTLQNNYKEKYRERVQKQAEIVKPGISRDEVDEMITSGTGVFTDQILSDQKHTEAKNALLQMQEQQRDLKQLEKSIQELNQLFIDMQTIVESSSENINRLEANVNQSVQITGTGVAHLVKANEYANIRRKRIAFTIGAILIVLLIVAGVIAALIAAKVGPFAALA